MSRFLATNVVPQIDVYLIRRDFFDGVSLLLQDENGDPYDLANVQICASIFKNTISGTVEQVTSFNIEKQEPIRSGQVRLWLSSSQVSTIWDADQYAVPSGVFYPTAYASQIQPFFSWDARIESKEEIANLVSISAGTFVSQTTHGLGATERVIFEGTTQSSINYNGTGARIYSNLTNITYAPPYVFTIATLSGTTNAAPGGSVYRLKQDTVVAGRVFVGTTFSNCFP